MEIVRAKNAGACYGVQRALELARDASQTSQKAFTLGPLIHNPQVVNALAQRGVSSVGSVDEISEGTVIIRSHGVTPAVRRQVETSGLPVIDATCPYVARAQKAAAKLGEQCKSVVVVGEAGHPEVNSLVDYATEAGASVYVAASPQELPETIEDPVGVVVQTTQTRDALQAVLDELAARGASAQLKDTVCSATRARQESAAQLARSVDAMVVIGGRNSSNTTRLAEICASACPRTYHIESVGELQPKWFEGCSLVGITAGASTPEDQIAPVEAWVQAL